MKIKMTKGAPKSSDLKPGKTYLIRGCSDGYDGWINGVVLVKVTKDGDGTKYLQADKNYGLREEDFEDITAFCSDPVEVELEEPS